MESAIAQTLRCPRTQARRIEDDYAPPYPAWVARTDPGVKQVVMAYLGVQSRGENLKAKALESLRIITASFGLADGPDYNDLAHFQDASNYDNFIAIAYWTDPAAFERWRATSDVVGWWSSDQRLKGELGYFREILFPPSEAFETLFSASDRLEGVGAAMGGRSAEDIQEHAYWGSMRDRLALSQTDRLVPSGDLTVTAGRPGLGQRVKLKGAHNIAVIRSGQDWTDTTGRERALYLENMEPILHDGMDFLRDHGLEIDCYSNRYMRYIDASGQPIEKSFGYSYWRSLAAMERWAESHPTHIAIFGGFMRIVQELNFKLQLRLYHEVSVLNSDQQDYEYINCHPATGLMNGLPKSA